MSWRALALLMALMIIGCGPNGRDKDSVLEQPDPVTAMRNALQLQQWERALELSRQAMLTRPDDPQVLRDVARANAMCGNKREAGQLLVDALALTNYAPASNVDFAFQALIDVGELYQAIELLERTVQAHPDNHQHRRLLLGMLGEAERMEKIGPHYEQLIRNRVFDFPLLVAAAEATSRRFYAQTGELMMQRNPSDHRVRLGEARNHIDYSEYPEAQHVLEEILTHHPEFAPAYAMMGQVLVGQRRFDALAKWQREAPAGTDEFSDYWLTLGDWADDQGQSHAAARAYWEATRRNVNEPTAWSRLAMTLRQIAGKEADPNLPFDASEIADMDDRVANLLDMRNHLYSFDKSSRESQRYAIETAKNLRELGRHWEAEAWAAAATQLNRDVTDEVQAVRETIIADLKRDPSWQSTIDHPALRLNLSTYPIPDLSHDSAIGGATVSRSRILAVLPEADSDDHLRLRDASEAWGLDGIGQGNYVSDTKLGPLIRSTGIGGGAIDYDRDGRPDLVIMGAGGTMLKEDSFPNELLRNLGDRFERVTEATQTGDKGFGQGLAVGDFNEDGFADLFYANLGKNRLLRNNGDGTFTDCTAQLEDGDAMQWTTCGAFIDIDGDSITDLVTTNYCEALPTLENACPDENGALGPCHPLKFPAYRDQYFAGSGDGTLVDATSQWIAPISPGRGLGILAGALDGSNLGILIANDMSANEYYSWPAERTTRLVESAAARGVAVDGRTQSQASMGIASGDLDGDGDLDIYMTGFGKEYNIYYEQVAPGLWRDETRKLGLVEPTLPLVGFGTQAVDLDDDGIDELVVTNGHIGEFKEDEMPLEQPFQAFRRDRSGGFKLVDDDGWGEYFAKPHVGRALWTLDANDDGRNDIVVTHTDEQIRLLLVASEVKHHRVGFQLVGTKSSRDAIGAVVRFEAGGRQRVLWCLAGHGYLCANEQVLRAGLGKSDRVENVTVTWPDGTTEVFGSLDADRQYVLVQGEGEAVVTREYR